LNQRKRFFFALVELRPPDERSLSFSSTVSSFFGLREGNEMVGGTDTNR
jgi:hypothetical protein